MPKATAVWLVDNTALTFDQIADFCSMHVLEIQAIADADPTVRVISIDPIANSQLTRKEITRCESDPGASMQLRQNDLPRPRARSKGARYTPLSKRNDRPDAIDWLLKQHPELSDAQVAKLIGTTKRTIDAVRNKTHWNSANIKPRNAVTIGLCTQDDLGKALTLAARRRPDEVEKLDDPMPAPDVETPKDDNQEDSVPPFLRAAPENKNESDTDPVPSLGF